MMMNMAYINIYISRWTPKEAEDCKDDTQIREAFHFFTSVSS